MGAAVGDDVGDDVDAGVGGGVGAVVGDDNGTFAGADVGACWCCRCLLSVPNHVGDVGAVISVPLLAMME